LIAPPVFDRVTVRDDAGAWRTLTAEQFLALPLNLRIQHILARDIQFFRGDERVDRAKALKSLRR
jgi:hypothetical protein